MSVHSKVIIIYMHLQKRIGIKIDTQNTNWKLSRSVFISLLVSDRYNFYCFKKQLSLCKLHNYCLIKISFYLMMMAKKCDETSKVHINTEQEKKPKYTHPTESLYSTSLDDCSKHCKFSQFHSLLPQKAQITVMIAAVNCSPSTQIYQRVTSRGACSCNLFAIHTNPPAGHITGSLQLHFLKRLWFVESWCWVSFFPAA